MRQFPNLLKSDIRNIET